MDPVAIETEVLRHVRGMVREAGSGRALGAVALEAALDRDLGLGSLERVELLVRLEEAFRVDLPEGGVVQARTVADLIRLVAAAGPELSRTAPAERSPLLVETTPAGPADVASARTLVELLAIRAAAAPESLHAHVHEEDGTEVRLTYRDLESVARAIALGLRRRGLAPGTPVAMIFPTSAAFLQSFFGILLAGGIPVPLYPPHRMGELEEYAARQAAILRNAEARVLVTVAKAEALARVLQARVPCLEQVVHPQELAAPGVGELGVPIVPDDLAFLQYTSGSTGEPKGVMLTHANLLANLRAIERGVGVGPADVVVSWLPLYHDMGLIGTWLGALYCGIPTHISSPISFLTRPQRWLWAIHAHRATITAAPNFAYDLCARKLPDRALEGLDLSSWRVALNGAEPVSPETLKSFCARFAPHGFRPEAVFPAYGLAENCVALTLPPTGRAARIDAVERAAFVDSGKAVPAQAEAGAAPLRFVGVGAPVAGSRVRIVGKDGAPVGERVQGSIQFHGASATAGYYRNAAATAALVREEGWRETGDLGYWADGELFVTGRTKDLVIKAGRNLIPQEIEELAAVDGVRAGHVAAFAAPGKDGTEALVIVAETRADGVEDRRTLTARVTERIVSALGVAPDVVLLAAPGTVPKTSSGKVRRSACRDLYLSGVLGEGRRPGGRAFRVRAAVEALGLRVRQGLRRAGALSYGLYSYAMIYLPLIPVALLLRTARPSARTSAFLRLWARCGLGLAGLTPHVVGLENLFGAGRRILVSNHTSYLDVIVLTSVLPGEPHPVAKADLASSWVVAAMMRGGGAIPVRRDDVQGSLEDAAAIDARIAAGDMVVYFPEGTFTPATGVRPFKMGAFKSAVDAGAAVVPIALRGVRAVLRDQTTLPRWGRIEVVIGPPLRPEGEGWAAMVRLRDATRAWIAAHAGEPALDLVRAGAPIE